MRHLLPARISAALLVLLVCSATASADVIIHIGAGPVQPDENLLFNAPGLISTGNPVTGATNNSGFVLDLSSTAPPAGIILTTPSMGQARVQNSLHNPPGSPAGFSSLTITANAANPDFGITELEFNVNVLSGEAGVLQLDFEGEGITPFSTTVDLNNDSLDIDGNGSNFFGIEAINNQFIQSVTLTALVNDQPAAIIEDVRQIRVSGVGDVDDPSGGPGTFVPEPMSLAIWALLAGVVGFVALRKRKLSVA